jgi:hypothetical protein
VNQYRRAYAPRNRPELDATEGCATQEWILSRVQAVATRAIEHEMRRQNVRGFSSSPDVSALDRLTVATVAVLDNSRSATLLARQISDLIRNQQSYAARLEGRAKRWDLGLSPRIAREPVTINPEKQPPAAA